MNNYNLISLGDHCAIPLILKELNLRKKAYPFDWYSHKNCLSFSNIFYNIKLIKELLYTGQIDNFKNDLLKNIISKENKYVDDFIFPHEFGTLGETNDKYFRRIKRLYENIINKEKNIYFIVTRFEYIPSDIISDIYNILLSYNKDSKLIIISGNEYEYMNELCIKLTNLYYKYIPYDKKNYYQYDYTFFRPQIKQYIQTLKII